MHLLTCLVYDLHRATCYQLQDINLLTMYEVVLDSIDSIDILISAILRKNVKKPDIQ